MEFKVTLPEEIAMAIAETFEFTIVVNKSLDTVKVEISSVKYLTSDGSMQRISKGQEIQLIEGVPTTFELICANTGSAPARVSVLLNDIIPPQETQPILTNPNGSAKFTFPDRVMNQGQYNMKFTVDVNAV